MTSPTPSPTGTDQPVLTTRVLVVDDSPIDQKLAGAFIEKCPGWKATFARDGREALEQLAHERPHVIVSDLQMPGMDGLQLVSIVRTRYPGLPVVLMTAYGSEEIALQALMRGAASYVPKRNLVNDLATTIENVLCASRTNRDHNRVTECVTSTESHFCLENDTALISPLVGQFQTNINRMKLCDETGLIRVSVAIREAIINAMEHGNLELRSELREQNDSNFADLSEQRRHEQPYCDRRVYVSETVSRTEARYVIRDEGPGFDPFSLADPTDPENLHKLTGRGVLLIRTFMDEVSYNTTGNQVTMIKRRDMPAAG